jgi:hypothetical protein
MLDKNLFFLNTSFVQFVLRSGKGLISVTDLRPLRLSFFLHKNYQILKLDVCTVRFVHELHLHTGCCTNSLSPQDRQFQFLSIVYTATNHIATFYVL